MIHINKKEKEALGLPLSHGDVRKDGYIFKHYYKNTPDGQVLEQWLSIEAWNKAKRRKKKDRKNRVIKMRNLIRRYKTMNGCAVCGYNNCPDALHFDHLEPDQKSMEVSRMYCHSKERIKEEIKKCRLLCANCHAEHTAKQIEDGVFNGHTDAS